MSRFDAPLAAALVALMREDVRTRPAKVADLGCGRGSYLEVFLKRGLSAVGVSASVLAQIAVPLAALHWEDEEGVDLPQAMRVVTRCRYTYVPGRSYDWNSPQVEFHRVGPGGAASDTDLAIARSLCCTHWRCSAVRGDATLQSLLPSDDGWTEAEDAKTWVREDDAHRMAPHLQNLDARWAAPTADWVVSTEHGDAAKVLGPTPGKVLADAAARGIVLLWPPARVAALGLGAEWSRDVEAEAKARLWAGREVSPEDIAVFRRVDAPQATVACDVEAVEQWTNFPCVRDETYGCATFANQASATELQ